MKGRTIAIVVGMIIAAGLSCVPGGPLEPPVATRLAFTNLSIRFYAALALRPHSDAANAAWATTPLLAPGATWRADFADLLGTACPGSLDLRVYLYKRVNEGVPIGLDPTEAVESTPLAAGQVLNVPACGVELVEDYTIVNWEAPEGTARVKIAQGTAIEAEIINLGLFANVDAAWEVTGVDPALLPAAPPSLAPKQPIRGRVTTTTGTGIENIGVLLRSKFRARLDDDNPANDPDTGWSDPIAVTKTDATGTFQIDRPAGAYRVEAFADGYLFRPPWVDLETPLQQITILAEPQP